MLIDCLILTFATGVLGLPRTIEIGGFFDHDTMIKDAFNISVQAVSQKSLHFVPVIYEMQADAFEVSSKVSDLIDAGVAGIFGPQDKVVAEHVQSICDTIDIPHISVAWDPDQIHKTVNLYPHAETLAEIYYTLVRDLQWQTIAILYENSESLIRLHRLIELRDMDTDIFFFHLGNGPNYRDVMQEFKVTEIENYVIDCSIDVLQEVLKQALQVGIMSDKHKVVVTSLDLQTIDLEPYRYSGVNFTGVRLVNPENRKVQSIFDQHKDEWGLSGPEKLRIEAALMYDAVQLFARTYHKHKRITKVDVTSRTFNSLFSENDGSSLSNFIRASEMRGLTGLIKFDSTGFRSDFELDIVHLRRKGMKKVGVWSKSYGIDWFSEVIPRKSDVELSLQNKTFIVLISLTKPYGMVKESWTTLSGNDRYEGFGIDIIQELSQTLGFNYTFEVQTDSVYGSYQNKTGKWTGMIGKIIAGQADLAITDLTITSERESAVDFTMPFMNLGISILYRKPTKAPPSLFSFLSPFSMEVWMYLSGAFVLASTLLFVNGRLCPAEWNNPNPCIEEPEELENQFTLSNAFWFTIGSIMQQGSDVAPIGISTRTLAGFWWFFCLIIMSSYTANLAACLAISVNIPPFSNVEELAKQSTIKYGAKMGGSTLEFFKNYANSKESSYQTYKNMYHYMTSTENVLTKDNDEGLRKVLHENYAFFMESSSIEYIKNRECNVTQVGDLLDQKGYGIAMKKGSPYRHQLNTAVLKLQESGRITELRNKWWSQKRGGGKCDEAAPSSAEELGLNNVGGVFVVLFAGVGMSFLLTLAELMWNVFYKSVKEEVSFKEEMMNEIKFIVMCSSSKPVRRRKSSSYETNGGTPPYGYVPTVITTSLLDNN